MAYPEFTSQSKGPDSSYDSTSWDSGSYLFSRVTAEFGTPPFVQGQEQIHGLSLSAVDPKSGVVVLSVTDGGRKHPLTLSGTAPSSVGASGQYPDGNSRYADPVSAVGVLFTYRHGASGLFGGKGTAARTVILSAGFGGTTISDRRHVLSSMELATSPVTSVTALLTLKLSLNPAVPLYLLLFQQAFQQLFYILIIPLLIITSLHMKSLGVLQAQQPIL